ncbi:MAG: heme lyase CcmF/NrfE family subunit [Deltaproteobacteria bacterium]|jgi:cytochrome c-type biogenesis protein CcmF|nr:heme lyase CcmF/NrfE family subunit [Deltaproteobacteria bacterium]
MATFGYALLLMTLVVSTYTGSAAIVGHHLKSQRLAVSARYGAFAVFGLLSCASSALVYLFVVNDYSVKYVQHYSDRSMPLFYKATSFWGGQDGSLLFWVWVMSIWGAIAIYQNRDKNKELIPYSLATLMVITVFFVTLMLFNANPFETYAAGAPTDGKGLNPLLQNPYMVIHPPMLYLGYIGWTIPFCFAIGALAHGKLDYGWIAAMRRWCLVAWVFLSVGLVLGGLWAYEELGWGGYWAWDPVENAAFMPWLTGTAFIHSVQVQERRQMYKAWNLLLIILTFLLTLLGTMMTRSGVVQSVHAFAQSNIGTYFFGFIILTCVVSFGLLIYRSKALAPQSGLESILSREFAFLVNNWILLAAAFFVTFATLFPSLFKAVSGKEVNVGPSFFNTWMIPIGLILLFLTGIGPLLSWRKSTGTTIRQQFTVPAIVGVLGCLGLVFGVGITHWKALAALSICIFVSSTIFQEFWRGTRHRMKNAGENAFDALITLVTRARRRYGGYVVHFGVVVMFLGFAGESFKKEIDQTLKVGEKITIGRYDVRLDDLKFEDDGQKTMVTAVTTAFKTGTDISLGQLTPAKWAYRKPADQTTTEVSKRMSISDDLYLVLAGYDGEARTAILQLKVNPLVNFVWLGTFFLMIGFSIAVWPERREQKAKATVRGMAPAMVGATTLALAMLTLVLAFI